MAKTVTLLQFNNYFNREVKGETYSDLGDYLANGANVCGQIKNMTLWNPNDGVDTTITSILDLYAIPDYAVVEEDGVIIQRWFVIEATRSRASQYRLKLHRDVIADNFDKIMANSDNYVLRGWCDVSNNAIYNNEPMTFNQIKVRQSPIYDKSLCPWIVMYFTPSKAEGNFPAGEVYAPDTETQGLFARFEFRANNPPVGPVQYSLQQAEDSPFAIAVMPYATKDYYNGDTKIGTITRDQVMKLAQAVSRQYSSAGWLVDLQLLPYCPVPNIIKSDVQRSIDLSKAPLYGAIRYGTETGTTTQIGGYISIERASFGVTPYNVKGEIFKQHIYNIKFENLTLKSRLVSPNGNGIFEYSAAKLVYKDDTDISFEIYCTYMPYQPYIRVLPSFSRMYGTVYTDYRGLICGGDFSLPQLSDAWEAYQANNKNYQAMFNRQIESLDLQQKWAERQDIMSAAVGALSGAAGGALIGGVGGAVVGGIASAAGGIMDVYANTQLRADQRDAMITQHNLQLQNVQALPYSVTKVNSFNIDSNYVPYLEEYTCDDLEIDNLERFLNLRSYTINRYGKFSDYVKPAGKTWLSGILIKLDSIADDSHYLAAIADEVNQGFYITK